MYAIALKYIQRATSNLSYKEEKTRYREFNANDDNAVWARSFVVEVLPQSHISYETQSFRI